MVQFIQKLLARLTQFDSLAVSAGDDLLGDREIPQLDSVFGRGPRAELHYTTRELVASNDRRLHIGRDTVPVAPEARGAVVGFSIAGTDTNSLNLHQNLQRAGLRNIHLLVPVVL